MEKEMDFDFDSLEIEYEDKTAIGMYDEHENLIQCLVIDNLANISIDYEKKVFYAEYIGNGRNGIKTGEIFDISFHKMVIV